MYKLLSDNEEDKMINYKKKHQEQLIIQNGTGHLMIHQKKV